MHELAPLIRDLAVILGVASLVTLLFQKIRQPVVLGYLIAGAIIGPYTPPHALVSDIPNIKILSELGIIFLMFSLGLEFSFHKLKRVGFSASITGFIEVFFMLFIGLATGLAIGWSFYNSLFLGAAIAISSTTIIIKALEELRLKSKRFAELIFGILIVEDLLAILLLVGLSTLVTTQNIMSLAMLWAGVKLILVVGGWFLVGYFFVPSLFRKIIPYISEETLTIVAVALCLFLVCIAAYFHYSAALGAFIMGSILAETPLVHRIEHVIQPIRNIFAAVFFVSVGMLIDPMTIIKSLPIILLICGVTILGKILVTGIGTFLTGQSVNNALRIGFSMAQIGEFSFIIAALGASLGATSHSLYPIIVAVSAITTFTTPYFIQLSGHLSRALDRHLPERTKYFFERYATWIYRSQANPQQYTFYRNAWVRLLINSIIIGIIFTLTENQLLPEIFSLINNVWLTKILGWILAILLSSPFVWGMLLAFRRSASEKTPFTAPTPLFYLSWIIAISEMTLLSIAYFDNWLIAIVLLFFAVAFFAVLYNQLEKSYHWFEKQLMYNLADKASKQTRYEALAPWDTHLVEIDVNWQSPLVGKTLHEHQLRQQFGINIVAIYRGQTAILSPRGDQTIFPLDKLIVLGSDEQIEKFTTAFIKETEALSDENLLENFALNAIVIKENDQLAGKSIRDSGIRERTGGIIVGLERQGLRKLNPDSATLLAIDDLLFIVGDNTPLQQEDNR